MISSSLDSSHALVVTDASIKNNVITSITHIHIHNKNVTKIIHYAINVLTTEAELFTIRCGINKATNIPGISKIIVITNLLHAVQRIFDSLLHPYQIHVASISNKLRRFFIENCNNSIKYWECPSQFD